MATQRYFHLHLVSDATGETLVAVGRAAAAQYKHSHAIEHIHSVVRTQALAERALAEIEQSPGIVLYTLVDRALATILENGCRKLGVPCLSILEPVLTAFQSYLGTRSEGRIGAQHVLDAEYFRRIEALNFSLAHDDGQHVETIDDADVLLVGVSRTSKTPTAIYLANRGVKTANFPLVQGAPMPRALLEAAEAADRRAGREPRPHRADPPAPRARDEVRRAHRFLRRSRPGHRGDRLEPKALRPAGLADDRRDAPVDRGDRRGGHGAACRAETGMRLILASGSLSRRSLLENAGLDFEVVPADLDERAAEQPLLDAGASLEDIALALCHGEGDDRERSASGCDSSSAPTRCSSSTASG